MPLNSLSSVSFPMQTVHNMLLCYFVGEFSSTLLRGTLVNMANIANESDENFLERKQVSFQLFFLHLCKASDVVLVYMYPYYRTE